MSVKNLVNEILRVAPGFAKGDRLVETLQRMVRGEELNSLEKANLMNFTAVAQFTSGYEGRVLVFYDRNGVRITGPVAECLRWASANNWKFSTWDQGADRLDLLGEVNDCLLKMGLSESVADDLVEPLLMAYDSREIKYLNEYLADKFLAGDWGLWTANKQTFVKMKTGERPPEIIEWCLERALLRKAMPYANW